MKRLIVATILTFALVASALAIVPNRRVLFENVAYYTPQPSYTTTANSTISVTNAFQAALAANSGRRSCLLQNTGTHIQYIYFGTLGNATTSNAFQISPGQTISCATTNGIVLADAVNIAGTAGDGYIVTNQ